MEERFWARVQKTDGCWLWTGSPNADGYGSLSRPGRRAGKVGSHRYSWELHNGEIPPGFGVFHTCDNPPCVNPAHLFVGEQTANMQDCASKGRIYIREQGGESNASSKLSSEQARSIREEYARGSVTQAELAGRHGVSISVISGIVLGKSYADAGGPITRRPKNQLLNHRRWGRRAP